MPPDLLLPRNDGEEVPLAGHTLELVSAAILELELRLVVVAPICNGCTGQAT
jgi:hypothetical protein